MRRKRLFWMILIAIILCFTTTTISYSFTVEDLKGNQTEIESLKNTGNAIVKVITTVGVVISVVMLIILGIKYMIGSTEEKAEYKKTLLPYVIGAGLLFSASGITQLIYDLAIQLKV